LGLYYSINLSICNETLASSIKQSTQQRGGEVGEGPRKNKERRKTMYEVFKKKLKSRTGTHPSKVQCK
jgi:hypothetical protein